MKIVSTFILVFFMSCNELNVAPPEPVYPIPSQRQMDWQEMEFYAFIHFNMNTFTNQGEGDLSDDQDYKLSGFLLGAMYKY